jgi:hypothetical protein
MEDSSAIAKNNALTRATLWMSPENAMPDEIGETQKDKQVSGGGQAHRKGTLDQARETGCTSYLVVYSKAPRSLGAQSQAILFCSLFDGLAFWVKLS